ncbi:restriction endonuclease subunit S [Geobacillus thermodenitrificans]|uniref:restriction endonuclease subunit S n=1 Tax=Geobacillus thermodenitrificans TaxID=33940 RepID=UPI003D20D6CC
MSEKWQHKQLGQLLKLRGGYAFKSEDFREHGDVAVLRISNIKNNGIDLEDAVYVDRNVAEQAKDYKLREGNVVIAMSGATTGKTAIVRKEDLPLVLNQRVGVFDIYNSEHLSEEYLAYVVQSSSFKNQILVNAIGGAQPNISGKQIEDVEILLPPLNEQRKIAAILSSVDEAIEKTETIIEQTEKVKKGLMQQLLTKGISHTRFKKTEIGEIPEGWESKRVGDLVKFEGGSQPPRSTFIFEPKEGYIRLLQIRDYKTDKYATYIPIELAKRFCNEDDVMIGRYGPPIFQIFRGLKGAYNVALIKAIPNENYVTKDYLYYFLKQEPLFKLIDSLSQRTSGQTGIDMDALKNYGFPLPPISEQKKITAILDNVQAKIDKENDYLQQLQIIKKGLMQSLLTGKVRVKVDEDEVVSS